MALARVDLPEPFGPISAYVRPDLKSNEISFNIFFVSMETERFFKLIIYLHYLRELFFGTRLARDIFESVSSIFSSSVRQTSFVWQ